jgi:hypothetical protein
MKLTVDGSKIRFAHDKDIDAAAHRSSRRGANVVCIEG